MNASLFTLLIIGGALGEECSISNSFKQAFGSYLECIRDNVTRHLSTSDDEYRSHARKAAEMCFASSDAERTADRPCVLAPSELSVKAWSPTGCLSDCELCQAFGSILVSILLNTQPGEVRCFADAIALAVSAEGDTCLRENIPDFPGLPPLPQLDGTTRAQKADIVDTISEFIVVQKSTTRCEEGDPIAAETTRRCLEHPFPGYLLKNCEALRDCEHLASAGCESELKQVKDGVCECIEKTRIELGRRFDGVVDSIHQTLEDMEMSNQTIRKGARIAACAKNLKRRMKTKANDWISVVDNALNKCLTSNPLRGKIGIKALIHMQCRRIAHDRSRSYLDELMKAFRVLSGVVDALIDRITLFL